ncbi:MFS transporter [Microbacterium sp. CCNWLW134]|uniref:MFS transporter n=1 Tax=Microbacterium sp. CCNWLW134 TaxID=3122064 RepID=UPI00300FDD67
MTASPATTASRLPATARIAAPAPNPPGARRWLALGVLALAQFLVVLDASIVNIALPVLGAQLGMDTVALAWVITAYVLAFGGLLLLGGRLGDRWGHRRVFLLGTAGFVAASALAGLSFTDGMLLTARALQGASAALLAPAALALLMRLFVDPADRSKALGVWGGVAGIGSAVGVLLGGVLTATLGWQSVFFINVPVGAVVLVVVPLLIVGDAPAERRRLDVPGAATIPGALVAAVGALSAVEQVGVFHVVTVGLAIAAAILGVAFVLIERRAAEPLIPLTVFRNRSLSVGNIVMLLIGAAMVSLFFALSVFMQAVLGYDALTAGLTQLPLAGALVVAAGIVPAVVGRFRLRATMIGSLVILAAGLVWLSFAPADAGFVTDILGPSILIGVGMGGAFVTTTQLAVDGVDDGESGLAGGLVNTSQQIGGALGLAVLGTLAALRTEAVLESGAAASEALTSGFSWLFVGAAGIALVAALVCGLALRNAGRSSTLSTAPVA